MKKSSWTDSIIALAMTLPETFTTQDVYAHEKNLQRRYPGNKNIRAKIRQQLQILRNRGMLKQPSRGTWQKVYPKTNVTFRRIAC